jgi:hypothetical protein
MGSDKCTECNVTIESKDMYDYLVNALAIGDGYDLNDYLNQNESICAFCGEESICIEFENNYYFCTSCFTVDPGLSECRFCN